MSLNRLMLRAAAIACLTKQPGDDYYPTMAGDQVFDSRLDNIEFDEEGRVELPILICYTDEDERVLFDKGRGWGEDMRHILLRVELAIGSFQTTITDGKKSIAYALPTTDAELEFMLDMFELQVQRAFENPLRPASQALREIIIERESWHSHVSRSGTDNNRLAARTLTHRLRVRPDCMPQWTLNEIVPDDRIPVIPNAPYLNPLIKVLAKNPEYGGIMDMLREIAGGGPSIRIPQLRSIRQNYTVITPSNISTLFQQRHHAQASQVDLQQTWTVPVRSWVAPTIPSTPPVYDTQLRPTTADGPRSEGPVTT